MCDINPAMSETVENPTGTFAVAARLLRWTARGEGRRIGAGLAILLISATVGLLQPWPMKLVLDSVIAGKPVPAVMQSFASSPKSLLLVLCVGLVLIQLVMAGLTVWSTTVLVSIGLRMVFKLRCALFDHIQKLSLRFHDETTVGDSLYRVTWDSYCVQAIFNTGFIPALTAAVTLIGISAIMLTRDWLVTVVALAVGVPLALLVKWLDRPMTEGSMKVQERESAISTRVQETLSGIRAVQAFGGEPIESERFRRQAESSLQASLKLTVIQTAAQSVVGLLMAAGTALIIGIGAWRVMQGKLLPGDVVLMVAYVAMLFKPLETLAYTAQHVQGAIAGARRVFKVLDTQADVVDAPDAIDLTTRASGRIEVDHVSFGYRPDQTVLADVHLTISPGQTVALVGPSGAGKTTLVSLLMRFYDPTAGEIRLDGQDLRRLTLRSLRENIALVLQEPILFDASVAENIAYGKPGASRDQIEAAAKAAGAHDFISAMPHGYETQIGERGVTLSGGQRQRLSIARAFLKDAPLLIMDEPTSALDAETEQQLLLAMDRLKKGRTTIIIAHRLSTIRAADVIVAMQHGRIVEAGSHAVLLDNNGLYARLYNVQFGQAVALTTTAAGGVGP
jgi:ATP-binding cassette, subfamily B, bacterial